MSDNVAILNKLAVDRVKTQSDLLAERIRDMIVSEELEKDFAFPNENEFCKILNVSRATLREAYKILDTQGFIRRTKQGTFIKDRKDIAIQGDFKASLDLANYREMAEFVMALEPEAVYLAAQKIDEKQLEELHAIMIYCEENKDVHERLMTSNEQFHSYIRGVADNTLITSALRAYYANFNDQIVSNIYERCRDVENFRDNSVKQHREIFDALKNHDAARAREVAYDHLRADLVKYESK